MRRPPGSYRRRIRAMLSSPPLRPAAAVVHAAVVAAELRVERALDDAAGSAEQRGVESITAVVKTFERPRLLLRLMSSLRRRYPDLPVIVVDDSREPVRLPGERVIALPYDSGVGAGRAAGLAAVETPYVLNLDDDFVFCRDTDLAAARTLLERHPRVDLMGGVVTNLPLYRRSESGGGLYDTPSEPLVPAETRIGPLVVRQKVPNFFLARTESVRRVGWDERVERLDHADFFTRARGILVSALNRRLRILHAQTPFDRAYMRKRLQTASDRALFAERYRRG